MDGESEKNKMIVHHNEFFGNALIFLCLVSFFLKENLLDDWRVVAGVSFTFLVGVYLRLSAYFCVKNNTLTTLGEYGIFSRKSYDLNEFDHLLLEDDKLFLIKNSDRIGLPIYKSRAHAKDWEKLVKVLRIKGALVSDV